MPFFAVCSGRYQPLRFAYGHMTVLSIPAQVSKSSTQSTPLVFPESGTLQRQLVHSGEFTSATHSAVQFAEPQLTLPP